VSTNQRPLALTVRQERAAHAYPPEVEPGLQATQSEGKSGLCWGALIYQFGVRRATSRSDFAKGQAFYPETVAYQWRMPRSHYPLPRDIRIRHSPHVSCLFLPAIGEFASCTNLNCSTVLWTRAKTRYLSIKSSLVSRSVSLSSLAPSCRTSPENRT